MISTFKHKGLKEFFYEGKTAKLPHGYVEKIRMILTGLNRIPSLDVLEAIMSHRAPGAKNPEHEGLKIHPLKGDRKGIYAVEAGKNFRITFRPVEQDDGLHLEDVNYEDYH